MIMIYVIHQNGIVREHNTHTQRVDIIRASEFYIISLVYAHCELKKQY